MGNRLVSVIMPCYREPINYFQSAIDSILQQTYKDIELILLLDDPDNQELKQKGMQYVKADSRVRFFINERNLKLTATLNKGIRLAEGDIIARLDADDIALPSRIEKQMEFIDEYDLISTNFAFINSGGNIIRRRFFPTEDNSIKRYLKNVADCMYHTTWLGKKNTFEVLNGYREIGPFEDYDFLLRAVKKNLKLFNLSEVLTYYRINTEGISYNNRVRQHLGSEFIRKYADQIDKIEVKDIDEYMLSPVGKKHAEEYIKFCSVKNKIYSASNSSDYIKKLLFYGPYLLFFNYYGRKILVNKMLGY
jgi:glycosyltransferase involved in cell wall biosynthesis